MTELLCAAFLLAGALTPLRWSSERYAPFTFRIVAIATYLAIGPRAALYTVACAVVGAIVDIVYGRLRAAPEMRARAAATLGAGVASVIAIFATDAVAREMHLGYPVPLAPLSSLSVQLRFWLLVNIFALLSAGIDLVFAWTILRPRVREPELDRVRPVVSAYVIAGVSSAPLQFAAHAVFDATWIFPWTVALGWAFLLNAAFARQLERQRRIAELMDELAAKERLAAVGEVTARVVHQTRHQLGLIGITVHRITKRVASLSGEDARVVNEELEKLGEVQRELSEMLTSVLRQTSNPSSASSSTYADVVAAVARRLDALAVSRGVRLELGDLEPARAASPANAENVSHAVFNVLENALVAAHALVVVDVASRGARLVIRVADDGPGIAASVIARAAVPFVTTKADGTGMGLAIARAAVEGERGALTIANRESGGCLVEISVPMRAA